MINPYDPPQYDGLPQEPPHRVDQPVNTMMVFLKWTLICVVCAAPSFVLGLMLEGTRPMPMAGMFAGILVFVAGYTLIEHMPQVRQLMKDKAIRTAVKIGYGTRIGISIIFPIGFYLDMVTGFLTVGLCSSVLRWIPMEELGSDMTFFTHFAMTIVQGVFANLILAIYLLIVFGICKLAIQPDFVQNPDYPAGRD